MGILKLGFNSVWFGVIAVLDGEMGVIAPPVGINVYVILIIFPQIALFLPSLTTW